MKGEAFLPFPSLELIGCVTRWPNPSGLMRGRPGPQRGRLSPPLRASERVWRPGSREGRGPRGAGHHLPRIYYSPAHPPPGPAGMFIHGPHLLAGGRVSLSFSLVRMPQVPKEPRKRGTFLRTPWAGAGVLLSENSGPCPGQCRAWLTLNQCTNLPN